MSPTHSADAATSALPEGFAEIADDFHALGGKDRLQLLLEFSQGLPELPERYSEHPELLEPVPECQSPIFLATEVEGQGREATAHLFFSAPPEAPTTRGFAAILAEALDVDLGEHLQQLHDDVLGVRCLLLVSHGATPPRRGSSSR